MTTHRDHDYCDDSSDRSASSLYEEFSRYIPLVGGSNSNSKNTRELATIQESPSSCRRKNLCNPTIVSPVTFDIVDVFGEDLSSVDVWQEADSWMDSPLSSSPCASTNQKQRGSHNSRSSNSSSNYSCKNSNKAYIKNRMKALKDNSTVFGLVM